MIDFIFEVKLFSWSLTVVKIVRLVARQETLVRLQPLESVESQHHYSIHRLHPLRDLHSSFHEPASGCSASYRLGLSQFRSVIHVENQFGFLSRDNTRIELVESLQVFQIEFDLASTEQDDVQLCTSSSGIRLYLFHHLSGLYSTGLVTVRWTPVRMAILSDIHVSSDRFFFSPSIRRFFGSVSLSSGWFWAISICTRWSASDASLGLCFYSLTFILYTSCFWTCSWRSSTKLIRESKPIRRFEPGKSNFSSAVCPERNQSIRTWDDDRCIR